MRTGSSSLMGRCSLGCRRHGEIERGSPVDLRLDPYLAAVALDYALADRQADACAGNGATVQSLEHAENLLVILGGDPDAIVLDGDAPKAIVQYRGNVNARRTFAPVLEAVTDQ